MNAKDLAEAVMFLFVEDITPRQTTELFRNVDGRVSHMRERIADYLRTAPALRNGGGVVVAHIVGEAVTYDAQSKDSVANLVARIAPQAIGDEVIGRMAAMIVRGEIPLLVIVSNQHDETIAIKTASAKAPAFEGEGGAVPRTLH